MSTKVKYTRQNQNHGKHFDHMCFYVSTVKIAKYRVESVSLLFPHQITSLDKYTLSLLSIIYILESTHKCTHVTHGGDMF